ncbi:hypothetical protein [Escherichia coli]
MTKSTITREQAQKIIVAADEVITALAGTNEDVHPDDSKKMCELWDDLNDRHAPPVVVRELARMALAAMDSEPVAEVCEDYALRYISHGPAPKEGLQPGDKLYRHAQQPVVIKGHQVREFVDSIHDIAVEHHDSQQLRRYIHNAVWSFIPHVLPGEKEVIPASSGECNDPHVWALNQMESMLYIDNETPHEMRKGLVLATYLCRTLKSLIKNGAFEGKEISEQQLIKSIRDRK